VTDARDGSAASSPDDTPSDGVADELTVD